MIVGPKEALGTKKTAQHIATGIGHDPASDLDPMIETRQIEAAVQAAHRPAFRIRGTVYQPREACMDDGADTHKTRFQGNV